MTGMEWGGVRSVLAGLGACTTRSPDPVNQPHIRRWCEVFDDGNPLYLDARHARGKGLAGTVAPLATLNSWAYVPLRSRDDAQPHWRDVSREIFTRHGFDAVIATNLEFAFARYLLPGEHVNVTERIEDVSEPKQTPVGSGHFLTSAHEFTTDGGERLGTARIRVLHFASPDPARTGEAPPARDRAGGGRATRAASANAKAIEPMEIAITPTFVVTTALATNDYQPVHHDRRLARAQGLQDIITNIPTTGGLINKYVTDRLGPCTFIKSLTLRLGTPNFPDHRLVLEGKLVDDVLTVSGTNPRGEHVSAVATIGALQ